MFDTADIYLSRIEERTGITCPNCESYLIKEMGNFSYVCLDCLTEFTISPMAEDDDIPFKGEK